MLYVYGPTWACWCEQEVHGHAMIPVNYCNPKEVGWVQAARWITRNAKLFSKGKLTDKRYQLIRDILGMPLLLLLAAAF